MKLRVALRPVRVPGYRFAGVHCGLKESGKRDVGLIVSERPAVAVGAFTTNRVQAAPVQIARERVRSGWLQAILVNSGNANAFTGRDGLSLARRATRWVAEEMSISERLIAPCSTGRIGIPISPAVLERGVRSACRALDEGGFHRALNGMMTTDAFPKFAVEKAEVGGRLVTVAGMAKGAGMIAPHMATMLAFVLTDVSITLPALRAVLFSALPDTFNSIVVDGDTSTNDTVLLLANGIAENRLLQPASRDFRTFSTCVAGVMEKLARMIIKDGEGASKVVDLTVRGARTVSDAQMVADAIARSPLCKAAFHGGDPYAGRLVCAAGYSGARFDPSRLDVFIGEVQVVRKGIEMTGSVERQAGRVMAKDEFSVTLDLHAGRAVAHRVTSDLTPAYVRFNSAYRT
jgi:glutamate N-acetyltransferase/amino-acid N-acetyltransferase